MSTVETAPEREVRTLPRLDKAGIAEAARKWVAQRLDGITDDRELAAAAAKIVTTSEKAAEKARAERDAAAHTIVTHYRVRRGASIDAALGVNRTGWKGIRDKQAALNPAEVPNAPEVLPRLAAEAEKHAQRIEAARPVRDEAAGKLIDAGVSRGEVAAIIGRDPSRVSHIKHREQVA